MKWACPAGGLRMQVLASEQPPLHAIILLLLLLLLVLLLSHILWCYFLCYCFLMYLTMLWWLPAQAYEVCFMNLSGLVKAAPKGAGAPLAAATVIPHEEQAW